MGATLRVAWRFIRADSLGRKLGIMTGNAVAALLIAGLAALPGALTGQGDALDPAARQAVAVVMMFVVIPVFMLLATVGRLSSATRDRRLATLRLLGVSPGRTGAVAMAENGLLALTGAGVGVGLFALLGPAASAGLVVNGQRVLPGTLELGPGWLAGIPLALGLGSAVLAAAPARRLRAEPQSQRARTGRGRPGWWRLGPFAAGAGLLVWLSTVPGLRPGQLRGGLVLAGVVVGMALGVPLIQDRVGRRLARSRRPSVRLAGRGILAEPASGARLVLGLGAVVFLMVASAGQLWKMDNNGGMRWGERVLKDGPQAVTLRPEPAGDAGEARPPDVTTADGEPIWLAGDQAPTIAPSVEAAVAALPEARLVTGQWDFAWGPEPGAEVWECDPDREYCGEAVIVATCADLAVIMPGATNCSDQEVRWMLPGPSQYSIYGAQEEPVRPDIDALTLTLDRRPDAPPVRFPVSEEVVDLPPVPVRDQGTRWRPDYGGWFIPRQLAAALGEPDELFVLVDQPGLEAQDRLAEAVGPLGLVATGEDLRYYREAVMLLTGFWALIALAVAVALLNLMIAGVDRARERRAIMARQFALGIPGGVLRRAQLLQVSAPLGGAVVLGAVGGAAALLCYWLPDYRLDYVDFPWPQLGIALCAVVFGAALIAAFTVPLTRIRLTPELLRRE